MRCQPSCSESSSCVGPADEEDVIYALNAKDTARSLGLQQGAAKVCKPLHP